MGILNHKERREALIYFILFFALSVSLLVLAMSFNTHFPSRENELLKREDARIQQEIKLQDKFSFQLEKVKVAVNSIEIQGGYKDDFFNGELALSILIDMYKQIPKNSLRNRNVYNNTILIYKKLINTKRQIKQLTTNQKALDSLSTVDQTLKEEYDEMKIDLEVYKQLYQQR